jgi:ElaB/YqjD/DUF883 family membrane-anchored ribosome-binding protein
MTDTNNTGPSPESTGETCSAAEVLKRAKAELENAQAYYEEVRQQAVDRVKAVREKSVGDLIDGTFESVRRHPGAGLTAAALVGFLLGRIFRR